MSLPPVSVIVVSRGRAESLKRTVAAIGQSDHPALELVVVADADGIAALGGTICKRVQFDRPGIAEARNLGLLQAAGAVVAFIDDDAVPEPTWASRLAAARADPAVVLATGWTRGRNGISFQWKAMEVDANGFDHPLPDGPGLYRCPPGRAVKPIGTNCAFRRATLLAAGGFDPAYRFYLEDADVGLRLAQHGLAAVVPAAQVHHGFAPSERRDAARRPLSLRDIGASAMVFLRRHAPEPDWPSALARLRAEQSARVRHLTDRAALLQGLEAGIAEAAARDLPELAPLADAPPAFLPLPGTGPRPGLVIAGRPWRRARLRANATNAAAQGQIVTLIRLTPTILRHRHSFNPSGFWEQWGGTLGRSDRAARFRLVGFSTRLAQEMRRLSAVRPVNWAGNGEKPQQFPPFRQMLRVLAAVVL